MSKDKKQRKVSYRKRQKNTTSIYFLLLAVFSAFSLFMVLFFGFTQRVVMNQTYKNEAVRDLADKGRKIQTAILETSPDDFNGNRSAQLRYLSAYYDVDVYILDGDGKVLFPQEPHFNHGETQGQEKFDFSSAIVILKEHLKTTGENIPALYEGDGEYCYGDKISLYEDSEEYLYITKSVNLIESVSRQMTLRIWLLGAFMFLLSFAVASAVSGWLTRPLSEMTQKARRLARGDFNVDFHGNNYGQEMLELAGTLNFARDELSKTDKMQKELIANVSHDFKTPLTMIKAYASMIIEISGDNPEKRNKHAQVIVDETDRLTSLVTDVLDLSKIHSGIDTLKFTTVDMSSYVKEILTRFDYLKETQGYKLIAEIDEDLYTRADELKIGQALYNLIGNAVNYTGEDKRVFVRLKKYSDSEFYFSVTDTGAGIKQEELGEIWDRYYRSSQTHKRPVKGTGLGLSIVKTVFEKHEFKFGVKSEEGKGSTFFVYFPIIT